MMKSVATLALFFSTVNAMKVSQGANYMIETTPFCFGNELFMQTIKQNFCTIKCDKKIIWEPYEYDQCYISDNENIDKCELCVQLISEIQALLESPEGEVILRYLCNQLPEPANKVCLMTLERIIQEIENMEPKEFCEWIQLC